MERAVRRLNPGGSGRSRRGGLRLLLGGCRALGLADDPYDQPQGDQHQDQEQAESLASHLTKSQIENLIDEGVITEGMLPKVESSFTALEGGVTKAHIIDGRIQHSLLLEVYTKDGIGTEIVLG